MDGALDELLAALADTGGMVLLTGDSAAGKSRALFESMRRGLGGLEVCVPDPDAPLAALPAAVGGERRVVWLDDLHDYLHSEGLTPRLLDELTARRAIVLSTLRTEFHEQYGDARGFPAGAHGGGPRLPSSPGRILRRAHRLVLERIWTDEERNTAAASDDPRVTAALGADPAHGPAEYLAAGPQVLAVWRSASRAGGNPRGAALVAAAVDLARTGVDTALPPDAVERLHGHYLDRAGGPALRPESLDAAWEWAGRIVLGVTSPLVPARGGTWKPFDYLVSDTARRSEPGVVPDEVWTEALRIVDDTRRSLVAAVARLGGRSDVAMDVLRPAADAGDTEGLGNLGALLAAAEDYEGAADCFRRAWELGDPAGAHNMGSLCVRRNDFEGAREWYTIAVERGELQSIGALGLVLSSLGDTAGAQAVWRWGTEAGDPASALHYSDLLAGQWQSDEALEALRIAADGAIPLAALKYAGSLLRRKDHRKANVYLARAYDTALRQGRLGDPFGYYIAGTAAYSWGGVEDGRKQWKLAREQGCDQIWEILEAPGDAPGLRRMAVDRATLEQLGEAEARVLMELLWSGDCLDCGYPLSDGVPALYVDTSLHDADARLFHFGVCRFPHWNESAGRFFASGVGVSWTAFSTGVSAGGRQFPALLVNPTLETAHLVRDGEGWSATGTLGSRSALGPGLGLRPLWKGLPPRRSGGPGRAFTAPGEVAVATGFAVWSAPAAEGFAELAEECGGLLLVTTPTLGPGMVPDAEEVAEILGSWSAMAGWVTLADGS
ncbi:tetratricopeptide repeat protein [Streptomyces sp. NPDC003691]